MRQTFDKNLQAIKEPTANRFKYERAAAPEERKQTRGESSSATVKSNLKSSNADKVHVISSHISLSRVNEPTTLYNYRDIIDTDEDVDFEIDHSAYADNIKQRFLIARPFILSAKKSSEEKSRKDIYQYLIGSDRAVPKDSIGEQDPRVRHHGSEGRKSPVLRHLSYIHAAHNAVLVPPDVVDDAETRQVKSEQVVPVDDLVVDNSSSLEVVVADEKVGLLTGSQKGKTGVLLHDVLSSLISIEGWLPSRTFLFNFFLVMRQYIALSDLLTYLLKSVLKCDELPATASALPPVSAAMHIEHVLYAIMFWIDTMPYDFRSPVIMGRAKELFALCLNKKPQCFADVQFALTKLHLKLSRLEAYEEYLDRQNRLHLVEAEMTIMQICSSPSQMAEQLIIIELDHLRNIGPEEYVQYLSAQRRINKKRAHLSFAGDNDRGSNLDSYAYGNGPPRLSSVVVRLKKDAVSSQKYTFNLEAYIRWINRLSYYVTTEIVRHQRKRTRAAHIEFFIDVTERSLQLNNFNTTMSIISGIDDISVQRMERTWQKVSQSHQTRFRYFQSLMGVSNNFATYRHAVANVLSTSDAKFYVPFLCVVLKDLYYLNEVMDDLVENDLINVQKMEKIGELVSEMVRISKADKFNFKRRSHLIDFFLASPVYDNSTLMDMSTTYEPNIR